MIGVLGQLVILLFVKETWCASIPGSIDGSSYDVAVIMPVSEDWTVGLTIGGAVPLAVSKIGTDGILTETINWDWRDTKCDAKAGISGFMEMWEAVDDLDAIIGGGCSTVCKPVALLAAHFNIPFISFGCNDNELSVTSKYPTFSRTVGPWSSLATMVDKFCEFLGWTTRIGIATGTDGIMTTTGTDFKTVLEGASTAVHSKKHVIFRSLDVTGMMTSRQLARYMKTRTRVMIVLMYGSDLREFLLACRDEGMMNGEYAYITMDADLKIPATETIRPEDVRTSYDGIINLHISKPAAVDWDPFAADVVGKFTSESKLSSQAGTYTWESQVTEVDVHAGMLHDAFIAWAKGVALAKIDNPAYVDNGIKIHEKIVLLDFAGKSGRVVFDSDGNRKPDYTISLVQNAVDHPLFTYSETSQVLTKVYRPSSATDFAGLRWKGGRSGPPSDEPPCGWNNEYCMKKKILATILLSVFFSLALLIGGGIILFKWWKYNRDLHDVSTWQITFADMSDSRIFTQLMSSRAMLRARTKTKLVEVEKEALNNVSTIKGKMCVVKQLHRPSVDITDHNILVEMKRMREIKDPNINLFVAAVCEHPNVSICMQYMDRGSLQDVLYNKDIHLNWDYKLSFAIDIAKGLAYLHASPFGSHGHLTSNNVVVSNRWSCKLTDYGAANFKEGHRESCALSNYRLLWSAPEILTDYTDLSLHPYGTRMGDVYSLSIILHEVASRGLPYGCELEKMEPEYIVKCVSLRQSPPFRPSIDKQMIESNEDWCELMTNCWEDDPTQRPTAKGIVKSLDVMSGKRSFDTGEKMLNLMEDHSQHLEEQLAAQHQKLHTEKTKVDNLLDNLLPPSVAERLMEGMSVPIRVFKNVSMCYVHVHDMDKLLDRCSDVQEVTEMLNTLCFMFDEAKEKSGLMKRETASNGVLYISGCPDVREEPETDVVQVAVSLQVTMAEAFPTGLLQLAIGLHSGPVVAGVVGLMVPRYCVFGETVTRTITMAKAAGPTKIHASKEVGDKISSEFYTLESGPGLALEGTLLKTFFIQNRNE